MKKVLAAVLSILLSASSMLYAADSKVSTLAELAAAPDESDVLYIVDGGVSKKITVLNLLKLLQTSMTGFEIHVDNLPVNVSAVAGLTFADASVIQLTGAGTAAVLTSAGNHYFLKSTSDNSAIEFATPANALTAIGAQPLHATLTSLAGLAETNGGIPYGTANNAYAWLDAGAAGKLLMGAGAGAPVWTTPTFPNAATTTGAYLRADGTNFIQSTLVLPNAGSAFYLPVFTGANTMGQLAASGTTGQVLTAATGAVPAWAALPANSATAAGVVTSGAGIVNKVWKTDAGGNPDWRDDSTGGTPTFDTVGTGTNVSSTMTVGAGGTLTYSTSGVVNASQYKGEGTPTAAQFGYLDASSSIQTQLNAKAPAANPTFTGTVTLPATPFTVGATAVTTTGAQFNYLNAATGTTGTTTGKVVFDTSPTFTGTVTMPVGLTGVLRADTGVVSVDSDVTDIVAAGTSSAAGKLQLASNAEAVTGTDTAKATTAANLTARLAAPGAIGGTTPSTIAGTSFNKMAITAPATSSTLAVADGKTFTSSNTLTLTATDGSTLAIGTGGTLGTAAYTAATAYAASHAALTSIVGLTETAGGMPYFTASDAWAVLAAGTAGKIMRYGASAPTWSTVTVPDTAAAGSVLAANSANTLSAVTSASGTYYLKNVDGTISWSAPAGTGDLKADGTIPLTANWDVGAYTITAKGFSTTKTSGTAGQFQAYNDYLAETYGVIFKGPTGTMASAYTLQYPNAAPTTGQVVAYGTPMTWVVPVLSASYANQIAFATGMTSGGIPYANASNTLSSSAALTQYGVVYGGGAGGAPASTAAGAANTVLHGGAAAPSFSAIVSADISGTIGADKGGTGTANNPANTITFSGGNYSMGWTLSGNTSVTFPASGTLAVLGANAFTGAQTFSGAGTFSAAGATSSVPWVVGAGTAANTAEGTAYWESDTDTLTIGDGATGVGLKFTPNTITTLPATTGTVALNNQTMYIGTTQVAINRATAALTLAGITLTTPEIGAATGTSLALVDSGTYIGQPTNGYIGLTGDIGVRLTAAAEDLQLTAGTNIINITSTTGVTDLVMYGATTADPLNLATTGTIRGAIKVIDMGSTAGTYAVAAADAYGSLFKQTHGDGATVVTLPDYQATAEVDHVKLGASVCFSTKTAYATVVTASADDKIRSAAGVLSGAAGTCTGPATVGAFACFILDETATDVGIWQQYGTNGAWVTSTP